MVWCTVAAIGYFLDAADALDYANYSETDYAGLLVMVAITMLQIALQIYSYDRIRTKEAQFKLLANPRPRLPSKTPEGVPSI